MKRFISIVVSVILGASFMGCGSSSESQAPQGEEQTASVQESEGSTDNNGSKNVQVNNMKKENSNDTSSKNQDNKKVNQSNNVQKQNKNNEEAKSNNSKENTEKSTKAQSKNDTKEEKDNKSNEKQQSNDKFNPQKAREIAAKKFNDSGLDYFAPQDGVKPEVENGKEYYRVIVKSKEMMKNGGSGTVDVIRVFKDGTIQPDFQGDRKNG